MNYKDTYSSWESDPENFWMEAAKAIDWYKFPSRALNKGREPFYSWYSDGEVNTCFNAVDRHVEAGLGKKIAIIYDSPVTGVTRTLTFNELLENTAKFAGALQRSGIQKGDRVIIYMPMIPEAIIAMLACARLGAIHSVVFGGFASKELAVRIDDAKPRAIILGSCGIEPSGIIPYKPLLDKAVEQSDHKPEFCVVYQREQLEASLVSGRDHEWHEFQRDSVSSPCLPIYGSDPLYILYTSGTTGQPKGVVRPTGGHLVSLMWTMENFYGVKQEDVFWAASDVGWVVGHSYIVYAPLFAGNTTVLFEGKPVGTPDPGTFWRVIEEHRVKTLFTAPTAFRAIKRSDPNGDYIKRFDTSTLKALFLAGERADPDTIKWAAEKLRVPVIDHWWQTETGFPMVGCPLGLDSPSIKVGSAGLPMPGFQIKVMGDDGKILRPGELGSIAVKMPLPPGALPTLWNADERFKSAYLSRFPGYYETGDAGIIDSEGYVFIMARTDDVINTAGHRLSTGAIEEVLTEHPDIAECAVIGVKDELKGQIPIGFICLNAGVNRKLEEIMGEAVLIVREKIGPVASFKTAVVVDRLPKTRSGKILRGTMLKIADGDDFTVPATIDDVTILEEIKETLEKIGYPK